jgi:cupin 2 domain-containing protein
VKCQNLFDPPRGKSVGEVMEQLLSGGAFRLERIVSTGQATPPGQWYDQGEHEWVVLLSGGATIVFEDDPAPLVLRPGDWIDIPAHRRHRVESTDAHTETVWLALHYQPVSPASVDMPFAAKPVRSP